MEYKTFKVRAQNNRTGRIFSDYIEAQTEYYARKYFDEVYRHGDTYTIISVEIEE